MHEERGRAGGGERRRELARDVAGLADAGHDDPAAAIEEQLDGGDEVGAEPRRERVDRIGFGREHVARERQRVRGSTTVVREPQRRAAMAARHGYIALRMRMIRAGTPARSSAAAC